MHELSIGKLAKAAGVSIHTVRFYEKSGLLPQPSRRASGFRQYSAIEVLQLRFVCQARSLGFSIHEIAQLLALEGERSSDGLDSVLDSKRELIDQKIAQLSGWRLALDQMRRNPDGEGLMQAFFLQLFGDPVTDRGTELT